MYAIFTSRMRIAHTASVMFTISVLPSVHRGEGGWVSGKVHYEHMFVTKVLMPMEVGGLGGSGKVHYAHMFATKVFMPMGWGGGWMSRKVHYEHKFPTRVLMPRGGVSGKVHYEHKFATRVLMPGGGGGGGCLGKCTISTWGVGCLGKCTMSTCLLQKCSYTWGVGCLRMPCHFLTCNQSVHLLSKGSTESLHLLISCI